MGGVEGRLEIHVVSGIYGFDRFCNINVDGGDVAVAALDEAGAKAGPVEALVRSDVIQVGSVGHARMVGVDDAGTVAARVEKIGDVEVEGVCGCLEYAMRARFSECSKAGCTEERADRL